MKLPIETATVTRVVDEQWGFARSADGADIFFHLKDGRYVSSDGPEPRFVELARGVDKPQVTYLPAPKLGQEIVFIRMMLSKGQKAAPWAHKSHWEEAEGIIAGLIPRGRQLKIEHPEER